MSNKSLYEKVDNIENWVLLLVALEVLDTIFGIINNFI
jgi:hypothetical protein